MRFACAETRIKSSRFKLMRFGTECIITYVQGSVFVEFSDFSTVEKFLKEDSKPTWNGTELITMSK
jgi:hypothetical protein